MLKKILSRDELLRKAEAKSELKAIKESPYFKYEPIGKFEEFINKAFSGDYTSSLFEAANGVGKTMGMANVLAHLFWPIKNPYFQQKLFKEWNFPRKGRIISYSNTVRETIIPMLKEVFPKNRYKIAKWSTTKEGKQYESHWVIDTGWEFTIMTYEQAVTEFESATLGFIWSDEPPPKDIYVANLARLRMGGIYLITETPLSGSQWIYDEFVELQQEKLDEQRKSVTTAELEDACIEDGVRGFLKHERILEMASQYDDDEKMARIFGKHAHLLGLVFKKFKPEIHIIKPFKLDPKDWFTFHALDPHPRTNDAGLWVSVNEEGTLIVCDELWGSYDTAELAVRIKGINQSYRMTRNPKIDPSAFNVDQHTGHSLAGDLKILNLFYERGSKERTNAIRLIRDKLDYIYNEGLWIKKPEIFFFDTCPRTIWEVEHWKWDDWRGKSKQLRDPKEKPVDKDDHMIENLGRILLGDPKFEEMPVETPYQEFQNQKTLNLDPYAKPPKLNLWPTDSPFRK